MIGMFFVWVVCMLVGGIPSALLLMALCWCLHDTAFKEYGGGPVFLRCYMINLITVLILMGFMAATAASGLLPLIFIGLILSLVFWFGGLMSSEWGLGMSGFSAFAVSVIMLAISFGLQALIG